VLGVFVNFLPANWCGIEAWEVVQIVLIKSCRSFWLAFCMKVFGPRYPKCSQERVRGIRPFRTTSRLRRCIAGNGGCGGGNLLSFHGKKASKQIEVQIRKQPNSSIKSSRAPSSWQPASRSQAEL
jgi:hypothetical protein